MPAILLLKGILLWGQIRQQRKLLGYGLRGCKDSDATEWLTLNFYFHYEAKLDSTGKSNPPKWEFHILGFSQWYFDCEHGYS